ncbi:MAG: hypothetical protein RLY86_3491, partial [Pseudomonadota bacterium]
PSTPVTWSLANSAGGRFAIDPVTGAVTVANGALIDFETAASHTITVRATDATGASSTTDLVITVINGNDPPGPITDTNAAANTVAEGAAFGTLVGIDANSVDPNVPVNGVTYSLDDTAGGRFGIDPATGVVFVDRGDLLDFETATSHTITIRVTDADTIFPQAPNILSRTQTFTISVTNVAELGQRVGTEDADNLGVGNTTDAWAFTGLGGNDTIVGGTAADTIDGEAGYDRIVITTANTAFQ